MKIKFPETRFQKVANYIKRVKDVDVVLGSTTNYNRATKVITIHFNHNLSKNGLYSLLHEVGHALQPDGPIGVNRYMNIDDTIYPKQFSMHQFLNEVDAWNRGIKVAEELDIWVDPREFNKIKEKCLLTYYKV
jgi:hypothetical protein